MRPLRVPHPHGHMIAGHVQHRDVERDGQHGILGQSGGILGCRKGSDDRMC